MNFLKTLFAVLIAQIILIGFVITGIFVAGLVVAYSGGTSIKDGSFLEIDIYGEVLAYDPPETIASELVGGDQETVHRILLNLEKSAVDDRIAGVVVKISGNNTLGLAAAEEIRGAITRVRDAGKPVYAYAEDLDRNALFLASSCDSIFMPPSGDMTFNGMGYVTEHLKGLLEKLGVKTNLHKIEDYKSAAEMFQRADMSPEARENAQWLLDEVWEMQLTGIADDRNIAMDDLIEDMEHVVFTAEEARAADLIDEVIYWEDLTERIKGEHKRYRKVGQADYADVDRGEVGLKGHQKIAVIHAQGTIGGRYNRIDPYLGPIMGHRSVIAQLQSAADDKNIAAIVFRVDSPGGESLASDLIAHEIEEVARKKPVIVSMLDVAASGGYMISYKATRMVADPMTITGSIGSIAGKFNTVGLYNKLGITYDWVTKGPNALFWSDHTDFTEEQWKRFREHHYETFNRWLGDVAERRDMEFAEAKELADGRVWTGRQALANGLIDELGGLDRAIEIAREEAGIPEEEGVTIVDYPTKKGLYYLLTSGRGPLGVANYLVYRTIRGDVAETFRLLTRSELYLWSGRVEH